jgi:hypothetical protein
MRNYYKCPDCLRPFVVEGATVPEVCSCGGTPYLMGKVLTSGKTYGHTEMTCECNEQCACASGPECSCACGGANHGKGLTVELDVVDGKMTVLSRNVKYDARGEEYRQALADAAARLYAKHGEDLDNIRAGVRIGWEKWDASQRALTRLATIKRSKMHKTRMEMLKKYLSDVIIPKMNNVPKSTLF